MLLNIFCVLDLKRIGMDFQILLVTIEKLDYKLIEENNIQSDAIIGNQCNTNSVEEFLYNGHSIKWISYIGRGVGLNRNVCLSQATADYCLFADDDIRYCDNYEQIIIDAFRKQPNADVLLFNLDENVKRRYIITKKHRIRWYNYLRYGAARIAIKLSSIKKNDIVFNEHFGGGTEHSHGEDNLFLTDCLRNGLKIYAVPITIGKILDSRPSTWLETYDDKYFADQGLLFKTIDNRYYKLLCLQDAIRNRKKYKIAWYEAYKKMVSKF